MDERLESGFDGGASLVDGVVRRAAGSWTSSVHALLAHLEAAGFSGAPRPLGVDADGREMVSFLPGRTVGNARAWPSWTHSSSGLTDVTRWLRRPTLQLNLMTQAAASDPTYQRMLDAGRDHDLTVALNQLSDLH